MKTKDTLIAELLEDIEFSGKDYIVYCWFEDFNLRDYSFEPQGKCFDPEKLGNLLMILTEN